MAVIIAVDQIEPADIADIIIDLAIDGVLVILAVIGKPVALVPGQRDKVSPSRSGPLNIGPVPGGVRLPV